MPKRRYAIQVDHVTWLAMRELSTEVGVSMAGLAHFFVAHKDCPELRRVLADDKLVRPRGRPKKTFHSE